MLKRLAVLTFVAAMCALVSLQALAADAVVAPPAFSDIAGDDAEFELTVMAALGIMTGDAGIGSTVRPEATITRAEMAKILVNATGYGGMARMMGQTQPEFKDGKDIPTWAWGYVTVAQSMGLIGGYPDGTFGPNKNVTYAEAVAMLIRCVGGHDLYVKSTPFQWPMNYITHSALYGFCGEVVPYPQLPAIRGDIAKMIFATMQVDRIKSDGTTLPNTSLLAGRIVKGELYSFTGTDATINGVTRPLMSPYYLVGGTSLSQMQYDEVMGLLDKKTDGKWVLIKKVGTSSSSGGLIFTGTETSGGTAYLVFEGNKKIPYKTSPAVPTTLNTESGHSVADLQPGDECVVKTGGDGYALSITAWRWDKGRDYLTDVDASHGSTDTVIWFKAGGSLSVPSACQVLLNGSPSSRDNLAANDVVRVATKGAAGATPVKIDATRRVVEGTVANVTISYPGPVTRVTINRTSGGQVTYTLDTTYLSTPSQGDHVKYGLDADSKLFVPITITTTVPYVLITGTSSSGTTYTVTADYRGSTATYTATVDLHAYIGHFGRLNFTSGKVSGFDDMPVGGTLYDVLTHSSSNATVREDGNPSGTVKFIDNSSCYVYKFLGTSSGGIPQYQYIGTGGLVDGADRHVQADPSFTFWVYTP